MTLPKLKEVLTKTHFILLAVLVILFLLTRLPHLVSLPVFVDEAIYVRWSQVMRAESTLRFLPLSDGKQPLFMWLTIPFLKLFSDPLFAGRFTSIMAGFGSLSGITALTYLLTRSTKTTFIAALLYILVPYTLFFDRMALVDSLLSMFAVWSILLGVLLVCFPRLDLSMLLGFVLGGALLTKSPAIFFVALQPLLLLTLTKLPQKLYFLKLLFFWGVAFVIAYGLYNILRLGPNFHLVNSRNQDYVFSFREVLTHPLNPFTGNTKDSLSWIVRLISLPTLLLAFFGLFSKHRRFVLTLLLWSTLPFIAQAAIAKVYTPRYLLFTIPPLLVSAAIGLAHLLKAKKQIAYIFIAWILLTVAYFDYFLLFNVNETPFPQRMAHGYLQEWTAGFGQTQVAQYLIDHAQNNSIVVGTEGFFGTLPDGLQIYTQAYPQITVIGVGQPISTLPDSLTNSLQEHDVYLVVNQSRNHLPEKELQKVDLIDQYAKPPRPDGTNEVLQFYHLKK